MVAAVERTGVEVLRDYGRAAADTAQRRVPGASVSVEAYVRERTAGSTLLAGGLAYRFFLWLVPFGLVVSAVASFFAEIDEGSLERFARDFGLGAVAAHSAATAVEDQSRSRGYLIVLGLGLLLWAGLKAVLALRVIHQIAWAEASPRLTKPLRASAAFTAVVVAVSALGLGTRLIRHVAGYEAGLLVSVAMIVVYGVTAWLAMSLLPHGAAPLAALAPGAVLFAVGMVFVHVFVVVYIAPALTSSSRLYGSLGGVTVLLLWLYVMARLIISAAFLNATIWDRKTRSGD